VTLFSETYLKPHERFFIAIRKGVAHNHVDLPPLVSVEATGVCIPIGNSEALLADVYKSPGRAWSDEDFIDLLRFRSKLIFAGYLNAKYPCWNTAVSNPSGERLMALFDLKESEISSSQCSKNYLVREMEASLLLTRIRG
jgi:hypothetical protein